MTHLLIGTHITNELYLSSLRNYEHRVLRECDEYGDPCDGQSRAMYGGGCGNLARLGFRYAGTTWRPMKEEMWSFALRRPARDWRFGSQRCETGAVLLAFAISHHMQHAVQPV